MNLYLVIENDLVNLIQNKISFLERFNKLMDEIFEIYFN